MLFVTDNGVKFRPKCKKLDCILAYLESGSRVNIKFTWGGASGRGVDENGFEWISEPLYP